MEVEKQVTLDLLDIKQPALSSTSDMPVVETKPDALNEGKPPALKTEVKDVKAAPTPEEGASKTQSESATEHTEESPGEPEGKKPPRGVQKRLDELARREGEAVRRAEAAEARLDRALKALETRTGISADDTKKAIESDDPEPAKPSKSDYSDPDTWDAALTSYSDQRAGWIARREVKARLAEESKKAAERVVEEGQSALRDAYAVRVEKAKAKYQDWSEVAESPDVHISIPMAQVIMQSDQGTDLQHYLGTNKAEAERISKLNPALQLVEMGQILATFKAQSQPVVQDKPSLTQAPKPIKPLGAGSDAAASKEPDQMSMEEYAAHRKPQLQRRPGSRP